MNSAENEQNPNRMEAAPRRETGEVSTAEQNRELQRLFENYKGEKIQTVDNETQIALQSPNKRLESAASIGYAPEQIQQFKQEQGIDIQLDQNRQQIEFLGNDVRTKIEAVKSEETATEIPPTAQIEQMENQAEREKTIEQFQEKRGDLLTNVLTSEMTSNGLDLVPFAGSGKMIVESISGKTLTGRKLTGKERIIHGAMGAGSLALDFTGIGEAKDAAIIAGKSIGLVEKVGAKLAERGAIKGARIFLTTGKFMAEHPQLTARAEQFAEMKIREQIRSIKDYRAQAA
jgi:hypothetical protein